jgi:hypothetical protein
MYATLYSASRWTVESTIIVSAAGIVAAMSTTSLSGRVTAGTTTALKIGPADTYGNPIVTFGLAFVVTAKAKDESTYTYRSTFDFIKQVYSADVVLPLAFIPWTLETTVGGERVGKILNATADPVDCSDTTQPNDGGNFCVCREGYARMDTECVVCSPGKHASKPGI